MKYKIFTAAAAAAMMCMLAIPAGAEESQDGFTMYYPSYMVESEGETLELDAKPEKIVALSNAALQIMVRCDVKPIAITSLSANVDYPEWMKELPVISTGMKGVDTESIISMEPDLVIMGSYLKDDYGTILNDAGIPVYYTSEGPSITYAEVKDEANALAKSFGTDEIVSEIDGEFAAVEDRAAAFCDAMEPKDMMILFSYPPTYQQTSKGYLGSMLAMMPFNNLSDTLIDPEQRTVPLDLETLVDLDPEVLFAISPAVPSADDLKASYQEEFKNNEGIWSKLQAIQNDNIIYLSNEYVTSKGIQIIKSMNKLMDQLSEKFGVEIPAAETTAADETAAAETETAAAETETAAAETAATESETAAAETETAAASAQGVTITYPAIMQERGYTDPVVLEQTPTKVVALTTAPVLALHKLGVHMIAIPKTTVVTWPEDLTAEAEQLNITMNTNFDIESVIAMEPDLAILGYTTADTYGKVLTDAGIPVYYVDAGHTVSYESIKEQTQALIDAFGPGSEAGKEMMTSFDDLEARLAETKKKYEGKTVMVLQSAPPAHYIQTNGGTLGSMMEMLGFTNVYENDASSMAEIDMEKALDYNPDLVVAVGASATAEEHQKLMEEDFAKNPDYWNSIPAIANGDIIYLPVNFVSSAGISIVDNINQLIDIIDAHYEAAGK